MKRMAEDYNYDFGAIVDNMIGDSDDTSSDDTSDAE